MIEAVLFSVFSLGAVGFALNVVFRRNPVHCALHLVGVLLSLSGLFVLLNAQFIAAIQILVYAGAIMVLFLFVVMLLNVRGETPLLTPGAAKGFGFLFALLGFVELLWIVLGSGGGEGCRKPYVSRVGPGWFSYDRQRYAGVFAQHLGIRPWEIGLLEIEDLEALIDFVEEHILKDG